MVIRLGEIHKMFKSARIKLTAYYLLIIMTISALFSLAVYRGLTLEIARSMRFQTLRAVQKNGILHEQSERFIPRDFIFGIPLPEETNDFPPNFHRQIFEEAKKRVALELIFINLGILVISGSAGYFLAGKTLKPIAEMVDEQKRFVADASHEIRTPLTAIKTEIEVSLRDKKMDLKLAKNLLESNLEEINKLKSLTDYFLTLDKYQNSNTKFTFETFSLSKVIEETVGRLEGIAKDKKIEIAKKLEDVFIEANKISIMELITILLDNAIKYSHEKGKVVINLETKKNNAVIKVEDFGIGIKSSEIPYIFNRFYRADLSRTKNVVKGYGLGLSIAKSIVDLHKGKISVESVVEKGSIFTILLPLKQKQIFV